MLNLPQTIIIFAPRYRYEMSLQYLSWFMVDNFSSCNTMRNYLTSRIACDRALNSASAVDYAVQDWNFNVQIIGLPLIVTRNPVLERLLDKSFAQSSPAEHKTFVSFRICGGSNIPYCFVTFFVPYDILQHFPTYRYRIRLKLCDHGYCCWDTRTVSCREKQERL